MAQNKPNLYEARKIFVDGETISSTFVSQVVDLRKYQAGIVKLEFSGFDSDDAITNLQISDENSTDDSKWCDWGGEAGKKAIEVASGTVIWELDEIPPAFMRLRFDIGTGTTATLTTSHILGY